MDDQLRRRLKRLGVVKGFRALSQRKPAAPSARPKSQAALPGEALSTPHGPVWVDRPCYAGTHTHGHYALGEMDALSAEALALLGTPSLGPRPAFLDTETTGLAGGAGTLVFMTGVGLWEGDGLTLHQVFLRNPQEEPAALHYLDAILDNASGLVTFNGRGFDLPLLESRFILNRMPPLWMSLPHLDLLPIARLLWRDHLASRRLGVLEETMLGIDRTEEDLPSWMIPDLYRQFLRDGEPGEMARIFYHNRIDVLSLVTLLVHVARLAEMPEQMQPASTEWVGLGRLYRCAERERDAQAAWARAVTGEHGELPPESAEWVWREIGLYHKRSENWEQALQAWQAWVEQLPWATEPLVEQAKYYEWVARDLDAALAETETALRRADRHPAGMKRLRCLSELKHRQARLLRKLQS